MVKILILNGPNLNILGRRDQSVYGAKTLDEINGELSKSAQSLDVELEFYQSNSEGALVDRIQENWGEVQGIIVNPGGVDQPRDGDARTSYPVYDSDDGTVATSWWSTTIKNYSGQDGRVRVAQIPGGPAARE